MSFLGGSIGHFRVLIRPNRRRRLLGRIAETFAGDSQF